MSDERLGVTQFRAEVHEHRETGEVALRLVVRFQADEGPPKEEEAWVRGFSSIDAATEKAQELRGAFLRALEAIGTVVKVEQQQVRDKTAQELDTLCAFQWERGLALARRENVIEVDVDAEEEGQ